MTIRILSWNIAGIRSCIKKGKLDFLSQEAYDIVCLQETKANECQVVLPSELMELYPFRYWESIKNPNMKSGQSGTTIWSKIKPKKIIQPVNIDDEGRTITLEFEDFILVNVYTPNSQSLTSNRFIFRTEKWDPTFKKHMITLSKKKPLIICSDLNVVHKLIDVHNPKTKLNKMAGLFDKERENFQIFLDSGFYDCFRKFNSGGENYTYWNQLRPQLREENKGWRIDYFLSSKNMYHRIIDCQIRADIYGSDHCPVDVLIK